MVDAKPPAPKSKKTAPENPEASQSEGVKATMPSHEPLPSKKGPLWSVIALGVLLCTGLGVATGTALWNSNFFVTTPENDSQLRALAERVAQVEGQRSRINALENSVNRLETTRNSLTALTEKQESDVHRLEAALRERPTGQTTDLGPIETRLSALDRKIDSVTQEGLAQKENRLALALGFLALKQALDQGRPFSAELALAQNLTASTERLSIITPYAATGVATHAALLQRFGTAADLILKDVPTADASWYDRLIHSVVSLVSIRKTGNVTGDTPDAILARTEYHLQNGNAILADTEFQKLPDEMKARSADFSRDIHARASADALTQDMLLSTAQSLKSVP